MSADVSPVVTPKARSEIRHTGGTDLLYCTMNCHVINKHSNVCQNHTLAIC